MICGLLTTLFVCCETPDLSDVNGDSDESEGNLTVHVWQSGHMPFPEETRATSLDDYSRLNIAVYTAEGIRLKQINQEKGTENFGAASFQLEPGTYQLVVVAHNCDYNPTMTDLTKIKFKNVKDGQGYSDASYYYSQVEVTEEPQDLTTPLERNVSLCRFILTDDYPDDVVKMRFQYKGGSGAFDAKTGFGSVSSTQTVFFDVTEGQKQFDLYTFLHDTEGALKLLVTAYDDGDNVVHEREFDVPMIQKQITWFSGAYFTGSGLGNIGITIVINTDWEGETHLTF